MRNKIIFILAVIGLVAGLVSAYILGIEKKPPPPVSTRPRIPMVKGSTRTASSKATKSSGENINIYPGGGRDRLPASRLPRDKAYGKERRSS